MSRRTEEVLALLEAGESPRMIAIRLGVQLESIGRTLDRNGHRRHARTFWAQAQQDRRA